MIFKRPKLEEIENQTLAPYALRSSQTKGRAHAENQSASRTAFQRDRDRIIHTTAFRRLEYNTQVFVHFEGDHYRTRLTHTLEVAQLGRSLARGLGCNEDIAEAICLAHDLGHPPFGHAGEGILNKLMTDHGGFNHNTQSYRVVTELEQRYPSFNGLNLTYETREGMIKHETSYDKSDATGYEPDKRAAVEAQIANLADEMAYNAHDLEDGLRANIFPVEALDQLEVWQELRKRVDWHDVRLPAMKQHLIIRELIGMTITDVVQTTAKRIEEHGLDSAEKVQLHSDNVVGYSAEMEALIKPLKAFLFNNMYRQYRLVRMQDKAERFISDIFNAYANEPRMLPTSTQAKLADAPTHRVIADYIAGMTDRYALDEWKRLFDPYSRA